MSGHTPGPWKFDKFGDVETESGEAIATTGRMTRVDLKNAVLIAKASAMYDALHSARNALANASMAAGEGEDGPLAKVVAEIDATLGGRE